MSITKKHNNHPRKTLGHKKITNYEDVQKYFFNVSRTANSIADVNGIIIQANPSFVQLWGYRSLEEVVGKHISDFFEATTDTVKILDVLNTKGTWEGYFSAKKENGSTFIANGYATALFDNHGTMIGYQSSVLDVTRQKNMEHQLNEAQRIAHIGSWELDLISNVLVWSDEIYRIFEVDPKKFGTSYEAFLNEVHPDDREMVNNAYATSVKNKTPYVIGHRLLFPDGRIKYVQEQCETIYSHNGTPLRSIGTVQDITEYKRFEYELRRTNVALQTIRAAIKCWYTVQPNKICCMISVRSSSILTRTG